MQKPKKRSLDELVLENKRQLMNDPVALKRIEEKLEKKRIAKAK